MTPRWSKARIRFYYVLHALMTLSLPFIVLLLTSCLEAEEDPLSFGPEASASNVAASLDSAFSKVSAESILEGEFVHVETSQQILNQPKFVTKDTGITVLNKVDDGESVQLTFAFEEIEYDSDGNSTSTITEDTFQLTKSIPTTLKTSPLNLSSKVSVSSESVIGVCDVVEHSQITYHNLVSVQSTEGVPSPVENTAFCPSTPCTIKIQTIEYDQVFWDGEQGEKVHCKFEISEDVPFLASQMNQCITLVVPIEERSILLTECSTVRNFLPGSP